MSAGRDCECFRSGLLPLNKPNNHLKLTGRLSRPLLIEQPRQVPRQAPAAYVIVSIPSQFLTWTTSTPSC